MKNSFTLSITLAIAALCAGQAMAGDAADLTMEITGMSARQMFPAHYGITVAPGKTRTQVQEELLIAQRTSDSADVKLEITGMSPRSMFPAQYGVAVNVGKSRNEVKTELAEFQRSRDGADVEVELVGMSPRQMFPSRYAKSPKTIAGTTMAGL